MRPRRSGVHHRRSQIPLRKNILFHKLVALHILVSALGHVTCHLFNWGLAADATFAHFEASYAGRVWVIWSTGFVITVAMFLIFSAAPDKVRRAKFKIFW